MPIGDRKKDRVTEKIRKSFMAGEREGQAFVPSPELLHLLVNEDLDRHGKGTDPYFKPVYAHGGTSNDLGSFTGNLQDILFDLNLLYEEFNRQVRALSSQMVLSKNESAWSMRELLRIRGELDRLRQYGINSIYEDFTDLDRCDVLRSKFVTFDTENGLVTPQIADEEVVDFSHHAAVGPSFVITGDQAPIKNIRRPQGLGTDKLFDLSENTEWVVELEAVRDSAFTGEMVVKLDPHGRSVHVNRVRMSSRDPNMKVELLYMNRETEWTRFPSHLNGERLSRSKGSWIADLSSMQGNGTSHLKFVFTIDQAYDQMSYKFSATEIRVLGIDNRSEGTFHSQPLSFTNNLGKPARINYVNLDWEGTEDVRLWVGADLYVSGVWRDAGGARVTVDHPGLDSFDREGPGSVRSSELREFYAVTGAGAYENWEPDWMRARKGETHTIIGAETILDTKEFLDPADEKPVKSRQGIDFYHVKEWVRKPNNVRLKQGKDTWYRQFNEFIENGTAFAHPDNIDYKPPAIAPSGLGAPQVTVMEFGIGTNYDTEIDLSSIQKVRLHSNKPDDLYFYTRGEVDNQFRVSQVYDQISEDPPTYQLQKNKVRIILGPGIPPNPLNKDSVPIGEGESPYTFDYAFTKDSPFYNWRTFVHAAGRGTHRLDYLNPLIFDPGAQNPNHDHLLIKSITVSRVNGVGVTRIVPDHTGSVVLFDGWNLVEVESRFQHPEYQEGDRPYDAWQPSGVTFSRKNGELWSKTEVPLFMNFNHMTEVGRFQLTHNTHRDNHSTFAIEEDSLGRSRLLVNHPATPSGSIEFVGGLGAYPPDSPDWRRYYDNFFHTKGTKIHKVYEQPGAMGEGPNDNYLFKSSGNIQSYYTLSYEDPGEFLDSILIKAELPDNSSTIHQYIATRRKDLSIQFDPENLEGENDVRRLL